MLGLCYSLERVLCSHRFGFNASLKASIRYPSKVPNMPDRTTEVVQEGVVGSKFKYPYGVASMARCHYEAVKGRVGIA